MPRSRLCLAAALLAALLLAALAAATPASAASGQALPQRQLIVRFKQTTPPLVQQLAGASVQSLRSRSLSDDGGFRLLTLAADESVAAAIARLEANPAVEYAEPNQLRTLAAASNDPMVLNGNQWAAQNFFQAQLDPTYAAPLPRNSADMDAAWRAGWTGSADVVVAVLDSGIFTNHPDLAPNIYQNLGEIAGNGIDDDANGYVDDVTGWDVANNDGSVFDTAAPSVDVSSTHGTHVAGTIAAQGGDGVGVAGVGWSTKILPVKIFGSSTSSVAQEIAGMQYVLTMKQRGVPIVAVNGSFGGNGFSQAEQDMINKLGDAGILLVFAAGNGGSDQIGDSNDSAPYYPSSYSCVTRFDTKKPRGYDCVLAVGAVGPAGVGAFSNFGQKSVDLSAPGVGIWSTTVINQNGGLLAGYGSLNGTSMATPHVAGAIAVCKAANPALSPLLIRTRLMDSAVKNPALGAPVTVSRGALNLPRFLSRCLWTGGIEAPTINSFGLSAITNNIAVSWNNMSVHENLAYWTVIRNSCKDGPSGANAKTSGVIFADEQWLSFDEPSSSPPRYLASCYWVRAWGGGSAGFKDSPAQGIERPASLPSVALSAQLLSSSWLGKRYRLSATTTLSDDNSYAVYGATVSASWASAITSAGAVASSPISGSVKFQRTFLVPPGSSYPIVFCLTGLSAPFVSWPTLPTGGICQSYTPV